MNKLENIVRFYRDCYQHDLKGIRITSFISRKATKNYAPSNNDFFHTDIGKIDVKSDWAADIKKTLLLNHKEKALYAGTYFIKGTRSLLGKSSTNYVPLYIHELELVKINEVYFVEISDTYLNPDFIEMMNSMDEKVSLASEVFEKHLPSNPFDFENLVSIETFFKDNFPDWDIEELFNYHDPKFDFSTHLQSLKKLKTGTKKVSSGLIFGIFNKPKGSLGVINELNSLEYSLSESPLLNQFFGLSEIPDTAFTSRNIYIPASLSESQKSAIFKADAFPISMILGPPGTGKSFTIACLALDAICQNKSVLIVSKNSQATRVIANVIENQFGIKGKLVKADNQRYKRGLASRLSRLITWTKPSNLERWDSLRRVQSLQNEIQTIIKKIIDAEKKELDWGRFYHDNRHGFFSVFKDKWIQYRKTKTDLVWKINSTLILKNRQKNAAVKQYIRKKLEKKLEHILKFHRSDFAKLVDALKEDNFTKLNEEIHSINFELILNALPIWLTTTKQISGHLPLRKELFDLVIVDEASQCDIASLIPVLYRAKNFVSVGDPQQLNHVSFLSDAKQRQLLKKHELDNQLPNYRSESVIDWTNKLIGSQNQVTFLDDHYRSKPALIRFSNEKFYRDQLNILRSHPIKDGEQSVVITNTKGIRDEKGFNKTEADAIVNQIKEIVTEYESTDKKVAPSIGISSPISAQVSYLKSLISDSISSDILKKHDILIGTPFHFQGEERDVMLISFTIDSDSHYGSINYLNREDVFNVLITRARNLQYIYTSIDSKQLPETSLLREYLEYDHESGIETKADETYDAFLLEITSFLNQSGYSETLSSFTVSGVQIDLTVVHNQQFYCIDLIGYPGDFEAQFSARNIEILNRMNVPVYFIPYSSWFLNKKQSQKDLLEFLNK